jgi:hypothetical protein
VAEGIVVVLVLVASQDAVDAGTDHLQERVLGQVRVAGIVEGCGEGPGQADALVELAEGEQPGVAGELARRRLDDDRMPKKSRTCGQAAGTLMNSLLGCRNNLARQQMRRIRREKIPQPAPRVGESLSC